MAKNNENTKNGGIGFTSLLTILFIALKLTHVINWSWWWVLSPVWIPLAIVIIALLIGFIVIYGKEIAKKKLKKIK